GEGDGAALPLRPADAARLEDFPAAVAPVRIPRFWMADAHALWRRGLMLLPFAAAIVGMHAPSAQADSSDIIYACQHFRTKQEAGDGWVHFVDMRVVKHPDGTWTFERANEAAVTATAVDASLGRSGPSLSLRWREKGKGRMAYLSFAA